MAYGWGWSEKKFFGSTPEYLFKTWKGRRDERERIERGEWERMRITGTWILAPYSKNLTPSKILPLPWDKPRTKEQFYKENKDLIPIWDKLSYG